MHNLFEPATAQEIIDRLNKVEATTTPRWGKMNAGQMMAHCQAPLDFYFSEKKMKRAFVGYLFGRMAKKRLFSDKPWAKNLPTAKAFVVTGHRNFEEERKRLIELVNRFSNEGYTVVSSTHPFFGRLSAQEWALLAYKHLDHHLQQFGA
jgi:Protein of unknown function (DUF1569)